MSVHTYINKTVRDFTARPILQDIIVDGQLVYELPPVQTIKAYSAQSLGMLWDEYKRILNPEPYPVDLSQKTYDQKMASIKRIRKNVQKQVSEMEDFI